MALPGGRESAPESPDDGSVGIRFRFGAKPPPGNDSLEGEEGFYNIVQGAFALWYKRLEKGVFRFPEAKNGRIEVTPAEMAAVLEGIDLSRARRLPRFALPAPQPA